MNKYRKQVVNLQIKPNGMKEYSTFYEGIYKMAEQNDNELGLELLLNLGNFSSLRIITKRHGLDVQVAKQELIEDLLALKQGFLENSESLLT